MTHNHGKLSNYKLVPSFQTAKLLQGPRTKTIIYRNFSDAWMFRKLLAGMALSSHIRLVILKKWRDHIQNEELCLDLNIWVQMLPSGSGRDQTMELEVRNKIEKVLEELIEQAEEAGKKDEYVGLEILFRGVEL